MECQLFVEQIQNECINQSITHDVKLLSSCNPDDINDVQLKILALAWQNADVETRKVFEQLMHLSANNSIKAIIHLIDTQFILNDNTDNLYCGELLDTFVAHTKK